MLSHEEVIWKVVRGELSWSEAETFGFELHSDGRHISVDGPLRMPIPVQARDVVLGLQRWEQEPKELQRWAQGVHAASNLIDLGFDDEPFGEWVLDVLWRLSFGEAVSDVETHSLVSTILGDRGSARHKSP